MIEFTKRLLGVGSGLASLPEDVRKGLEGWRGLPTPPRDGLHFYSRYVAVDVASAGLNAASDALLGIAGVGVVRAGILVPEDAFALDFPEALGQQPEGLVERQLLAFLEFIGKDPVVTYQVPFVSSFLEKVYAERLGIDFQPEWIDLAWLLPDLFNERIDAQVPLDAWLGSFGIDVPGRRDAMSDAVAVARLLQAALSRASGCGIDSPGRLMDTAKARRWLRHSG